MTCTLCHQGFVPFVSTANPKSDADVGADDLLFAVCGCSQGQVWRNAKNNGHSVTPLWRVWCAKYGVDTSRVFMAEDVFDGHTPTAVDAIDRAAALLAAGQKRRGDRPHK